MHQHQHPSSNIFIIQCIHHLHQHLFISLTTIFNICIHYLSSSDYNINIFYHPPSIINHQQHHSTSIININIIHHPSFIVTYQQQHHHQSITSSNITFCIININHPASINNTNIIQYHLLYHQLSRSTSINIHHQHLCICDVLPCIIGNNGYNITS